MLKKEAINRLSKLLGVENLAEILTSEDKHDLTIPTLYTEEEKEQFGKNKFDEAKKVYREIFTKDLKKKFGVEVETDDITKIVKTIVDKSIEDAKIPANEKVEALLAEKETLQNKYKEIEQKLNETESEYKQRMFNFEIKQKILSNLPSDTVVPREDLAELFLMKHKIKNEDGKLLIEKEGEILKDHIENPLPINDVVKSFAEDYIKKDKPGDGAGAGEEGGKFKSTSQWAKWAHAKGYALMSDEAQQALISRKAKDFVNDEIPAELM